MALIDFLVTLPIECWSRAHLQLGGRELRVRPGHKHKSLQLAGLMLAGAGGLLQLDSQLPEGKGMASSSADLVATARAVADVTGQALDGRAIEVLLRYIEPSDGVMYDGVVAFEHRAVRMRARLGPVPRLIVVGLDEGGRVDTVGFNRIQKPFSCPERWEYAELLDRLVTAIPAGDLATIGRVATRSAVLNQRIQHHRALPALVRTCRDIGGVGVAAAHSGTVIGILLAADASDLESRIADARRACLRIGGNATVHRLLASDGPTNFTSHR